MFSKYPLQMFNVQHVFWFISYFVQSRYMIWPLTYMWQEVLLEEIQSLGVIYGSSRGRMNIWIYNL